jgi:hypothetical protein
VRCGTTGTPVRDVLLPGHREPVPDGAGVDIARAAASFGRLVPPPNFLTDP